MSEPTAEKKRVTPLNVLNACLIVVLFQLVAILLTFQDLPALSQVVSVTGPSFAPAGTSPSGSVGNVVILVVFAFGATVILLRVLRRKMVLSFKFLIFGSTAVSAFLLTFITVDSLAHGNVPAEVELYLGIAVALIPVALVGYTVFVKNHPIISTAVLAFVGAEVGSFFASTLDLGTALLLPLAFSAYDIYAVFRGPLKHLIGTAPGIALNGMSVKLGEFTLGLGDVVFYSMIPSLAYVHTVSPPIVAASATLATILAIGVGVLTTLVLLTRKRLLPGLPIPMFLGVSVLVVYLV